MGIEQSGYGESAISKEEYQRHQFDLENKKHIAEQLKVTGGEAISIDLVEVPGENGKSILKPVNETRYSAEEADELTKEVSKERYMVSHIDEKTGRNRKDTAEKDYEGDAIDTYHGRGNANEQKK